MTGRSAAGLVLLAAALVLLSRNGRRRDLIRDPVVSRIRASRVPRRQPSRH